MSQFKLLDVYPEPPLSTSKKKGYALVDVDSKMQIYMVILEGKTGYFLKFPSISIADRRDATQRHFKPALSFNSDLEKRISHQLSPLLQNHVALQ